MMKAFPTQHTAPHLLASSATHATLTRVTDNSLPWVVRIRYKIGLLLLAILIVASALGAITTTTTIRLAITNVVYLLTSLFYTYTLSRNPSTRLVAIIRSLQVPEFLLLATTATYYSGGVLSPFFILFPLSILLAIILLPPAGVYRTGILAVTLYSSLALLEVWGKGQPGLLPFTQHLSGAGALALGTSPLPLGVPASSIYALYVTIVSSVLLLTAHIGNRVALLIGQRNRQIETQLQDSRVLYDIADKLGNMVDEDDMLSYLAATLKSLDNASMCLVGLLDKDGSLAIKATADAPSDMAAQLHGITSSTPGLVDLLQRGETLVINDIHQHPHLKDFAVKPGSHSVYIFPIKASLEHTGNLHTDTQPTATPVAPATPKIQNQTSVLGGISLSFDSIKPLSPELNALMTTITTQAALAIQRAQLIADAHRLANEMSQLYTLGLYTGSTLSRDEVLRRTSDNIESLMNPDAYYIALYNEVTDLLSFEVFVEHGRQIGKMKIPLDQGGVTSRVIQGGQPILVQDWATANDELRITNYELDRSQTIQNSKFKTHNSTPNMLSYLGVPMMWEDRVIGVISVQCEQSLAFDLHDERLLAALAAQTAMALENARLHQLAQDQACLDSLTGVYNHGHFVQLVRTAVAESDTDDTQVALIMLDIDHFKHYNDSFGHVAGDNVLKMVAQALKKCVRETDAVGRWGGEEFGVLLLGIGITEAKKIARQIRRGISELSPANGYGQVLPNPTISQGISSYPYPSATANDLIEEADTALYHAKKHGRNQLVVYEAAGGMKDDTTTTGHLTRSRAAKDLHITTDNMRSPRHAKQQEEELAVTTNDLDHNGEGTTNPQLASASIRD